MIDNVDMEMKMVENGSRGVSPNVGEAISQTGVITSTSPPCHYYEQCVNIKRKERERKHQEQGGWESVHVYSCNYPYLSK